MYLRFQYQQDGVPVSVIVYSNFIFKLRSLPKINEPMTPKKTHTQHIFKERHSATAENATLQGRRDRATARLWCPLQAFVSGFFL